MLVGSLLSGYGLGFWVTYGVLRLHPHRGQLGCLAYTFSNSPNGGGSGGGSGYALVVRPDVCAMVKHDGMSLLDCDIPRIRLIQMDLHKSFYCLTKSRDTM